MPRVNLGRDPVEERREATWSLEEMVKLCKALHLTQEDCSAILGVSK